MKEKNAYLTQEVADLNLRIGSYEKAVGDARVQLLTFADRANTNLSAALAIAQHHYQPSTGIYENLSACESWIAGVRVALRDFLQLPFPGVSDGSSAPQNRTSALIKSGHWIRDAVEVINKLPEHEIQIVGTAPKFRGSADLFKAAMGQLILKPYEGLHPSRLTMSGRFIALRFGFIGSGAANIIPADGDELDSLHLDPQQYLRHELTYASYLIEAFGGRLIVRGADDGAEVKIEFPQIQLPKTGTRAPHTPRHGIALRS